MTCLLVRIIWHKAGLRLHTPQATSLVEFDLNVAKYAGQGGEDEKQNHSLIFERQRALVWLMRLPRDRVL